MADKIVTLEELRAHTSKDSLYVLLHEKGVLCPRMPRKQPGSPGYSV